MLCLSGFERYSRWAPLRVMVVLNKPRIFYTIVVVWVKAFNTWSPVSF